VQRRGRARGAHPDQSLPQVHHVAGHGVDEHHDHAILRFSSGLEGTPEGDMHMAMIARSGWHAVGQRVGTMFVWVNKAYSRGSVTLASPDVRTEPDVDFQLLSDWRDLERLKGGFRHKEKKNIN